MAYENLQKMVGKKIEKVGLDELMGKHADAFFGELTDLFNFVFEYRNDDYEPVTIEWVMDNVSLRQFRDIGRALAEQNQVGWLLPLLAKQFQTNMGINLLRR